MANKEQLVIYKGKDGKIELQVQLADDTIWLTRESIAQLFNVDRSGVSRHIKNVLADSEVEKKSNVQKIHIANSDKPVEFFSLDIILAVKIRKNHENYENWAPIFQKKILEVDF